MKNLTSAVIADRYKLECELARGGMGTVWLGRDEKLGRQVAVKVMAQELAKMSEPLQRFQREAMAVAQLRSTHVVQVYDYGVQDDLPYIVMELLDGESLGQRLKVRGRLQLPDVARITHQICKGLKAAHEAGLVHRDLKPSNIFLAKRDDAEVVKLLDFGVVKAVDQMGAPGLGAQESTASGILLGTPQYMSPEQARAKREIDHRSDLWSVGVIIFRMISGNNPFKGESVGDVVLKICSDELPKISEQGPFAPQALDAFFDKALARDPAKRFQSATELAAAFAQYSGAPAIRTQTPPPSSVMSGAFAPPQSAPGAPDPNTYSGAMPVTTAIPEARVSQPGAHAAAQSYPQATTHAQAQAVAAAHEPTPHSTTVGGTQLLSDVPPKRPPEWALPAIVGGCVALLALVGIVAAFAMDGGESQGSPVPATSGVATTPTAAPTPTTDDTAGPTPGDLDEDGLEPVASASASASASTKPKVRPPPTRHVPAGRRHTPKPKATSKPSWF